MTNWPPSAAAPSLIRQPPERGWICPKCQRVHAPFVPACHPCNQPINSKDKHARDFLARAGDAA